jgi:autotransporter-associated beta strand protein
MKNIPRSVGQARVLRPVTLFASSLLFCGSAWAATDFSWNNASQSTWSTAGNWTPGGGPPGSGDNVVASTQFGNILINVSPTVANWTYASDTTTTQQIIGNVASSSPALTITGTLSKSGTGTLRFRDSSASTTLTVNIGQITATGGVLEFGTAASTTNGLRSLTIGSASITDTKVGINMLNSSGNLATVTNNLSLGGTAELSIAQVATTTSGILSVGSLSSTNTTTIIQANSFTSTATSIGTLVLNNSTGSTSYAGEIKTSAKVNVGNLMSVTKNGAGTQIFTGNNNTYNGTTTVNAGTLLINNASGSGTGTSTITVNNGGRFGGTGSATGAVTVASGGAIVGGAGTAADDLSLSGNVTFNDGSVIELTLAGSGAHSSLTRTAGTWSFDADQSFLFGDSGAQVGLYNNIISGLSGTESGLSSISSWSIQNAGWTGVFTYDGAGGVDLNITSFSSVPEPSSMALIFGGTVMLFAARRGPGKRSA